jgi:hypothetical protein
MPLHAMNAVLRQINFQSSSAGKKVGNYFAYFNSEGNSFLFKGKNFLFRGNFEIDLRNKKFAL